MNWLGILPILIGVVYLIYSICYRDKITYYNKRSARKTAMTIIKPREFFRMQLKFAILNSAYLIIAGIVIIVFNVSNIFVILSIGGFHFINFILVIQSKMKGYTYYE
ncbi:hypothetical protein [Clostridium beijerinckii]|uniref:DUF3784 domain-containing protein n=1 Tax=Clostridium beijerinckii TaxID=1520 RepID=A0A1S8RDV6_CLOBE|nr:hypothetical protein [Clostridium beijerinckii]NRY59447.1 hypothetical protein [Clostridium beijerinckii]OOM51407.1 hypothetical protein CLBCK_50430 [Clostridium beijerinckii]